MEKALWRERKKSAFLSLSNKMSCSTSGELSRTREAPRAAFLPQHRAPRHCLVPQEVTVRARYILCKAKLAGLMLFLPSRLIVKFNSNIFQDQNVTCFLRKAEAGAQRGFGLCLTDVLRWQRDIMIIPGVKVKELFIWESQGRQGRAEQGCVQGGAVCWTPAGDASFSGAVCPQASTCIPAENSCWLFSPYIVKTSGKFFNPGTFTIFSFSKRSVVILINLWGIGLAALKAHLYCVCLKHTFKGKS